MRRLWFVAMVACILMQAGCSRSIDGRRSVSADAGRAFTISEIGLGAAGWVTLRNFTDQPARLDGLRLCQGSGCIELAEGAVPAGAVVRVATGSRDQLPDAVMHDVDLDLRPSDGEIGLYASEVTEDESSIRAYVEWGSTPHELTSTAVQAGLWRDGSFAPSSPEASRLYLLESGLWVFD